MLIKYFCLSGGSLRGYAVCIIHGYAVIRGYAVFTSLQIRTKRRQKAQNMMISFKKLKKIVKCPIATFWYHHKLEQKASNGPEYQYFLHQIISLKCDVLISSHSLTKTLKWSKITTNFIKITIKKPKTSSRNVFISS